MMDAHMKAVEDIAGPICKEQGCEIFGISIPYRDSRFVVEIIVDYPQGGITLDDCTVINKKLVSVIEEQDVFGDDDYVIEVSSPGLDRPLTDIKDFGRVIGRSIRVHLSEPIENKKEYAGKLREVNEDRILLDNNGQTLDLPIEKIHKAMQIVEKVEGK